eukprot:m51a1_g4071 hypothetical protein (423) ;mRNA; r:756058-757851
MSDEGFVSSRLTEALGALCAISSSPHADAIVSPPPCALLLVELCSTLNTDEPERLAAMDAVCVVCEAPLGVLLFSAGLIPAALDGLDSARDEVITTQCARVLSSALANPLAMPFARPLASRPFVSVCEALLRCTGRETQIALCKSLIVWCSNCCEGGTVPGDSEPVSPSAHAGAPPAALASRTASALARLMTCSGATGGGDGDDVECIVLARTSLVETRVAASAALVSVHAHSDACAELPEDDVGPAARILLGAIRADITRCDLDALQVLALMCAEEHSIPELLCQHWPAMCRASARKLDSPAMLPQDHDRLTGLLMILMLHLPQAALELTPPDFARRVLQPRSTDSFPMCVRKSLAERMGVSFQCSLDTEEVAPARPRSGEEFNMDAWMHAVALVMLGSEEEEESVPAYKCCAMSKIRMKW